MAETLSALSIVSFVVAFVFLVLAIVLWFLFDIPTVVGDLTGRTARKSIAKMRAENEKKGATAKNVAKVKSSKKFTELKAVSLSEEERPETGLLVDNRADMAEPEETGILDDAFTDASGLEETGLLLEANEKKSVESRFVTQGRIGGKTLTIIEEIILIHTDEVLEY